MYNEPINRSSRQPFALQPHQMKKWQQGETYIQFDGKNESYRANLTGKIEKEQNQFN